MLIAQIEFNVQPVLHQKSKKIVCQLEETRLCVTYMKVVIIWHEKMSKLYTRPQQPTFCACPSTL